MMQTIGTCSICKGPVQIPYVWMGVIPPVPTCSRCGAIPKSPHGEVVEMEKVHGKVEYITNSTK